MNKIVSSAFMIRQRDSLYSLFLKMSSGEYQEIACFPEELLRELSDSIECILYDEAIEDAKEV